MAAEIINGDALETLRTLDDDSIQCCVTSPPYWGLRDYGTAKWEGGDPDCDHRKVSNPDAGTAKSGLQGGKKTNGHQQEGFIGECGKCGAIRVDEQLGLERTPEKFIGKLVAIFAEVRRVLKPDGTCWVNLGDSYAMGTKGAGGLKHEQSTNAGSIMKDRRGLKPKDLVGIPWRFAFAAQADGWWLRQDIVWSKPNPMPESVTDRCTKAHEYIFMLTKSQRYFYDAAAVKEPASDALLRQVAEGYNGSDTKLFDDSGAQSASGTKSRIIEGKRRILDKQRGHERRHEGFNGRWEAMTKEEQQALGSNKRSVWQIATKPYSDAHFATYPPDLIKPCILAGSRPGDTVLDPFAGSGTTGQVAIELGREAVLIELNPDYIPLIRQRCDVTPGLPWDA